MFESDYGDVRIKSSIQCEATVHVTSSETRGLGVKSFL
jgi:hypothetical protein